MDPDLREEQTERDDDNIAASLREFVRANNSETVSFQSCNLTTAAIEMTDTRVSKMFAKCPNKFSSCSPRGRIRLS
jgi:hypothetical protein